jgi:hypothetical protein
VPREAMMDAWSDIRRGIPFRLLRGDTLLGTLAVHEAGPEWLVCAFDPTAAFAPIHPLFDTTSGTFADPLRHPVRAEHWADLRARLAAHDVRIVTSGGPTGQFTLHIDGHKAWLHLGAADEPGDSCVRS